MSDTSKYDKKTPREHVLARPDTYIGDIELTNEIMWVYNENKNLIEKENISFTPGFLKIFDEILVNARDHSINDPGCDTIKIEYNMEKGYISVFNNGSKPIPVEEHPKHKILVPSMIFGEMLSGSNFDDTKKRTTGGRNGYGAKLANIFSKEFSVEILDTERKKKFKQTWKNNMSEVGKAKVTNFNSGNNYVKITFYPDLEKFGLQELDNNHFKLFHRRSIDILGVSCNKLKIFFNGKKIPINTFKKYSELYYPEETIFFDDKNKRWNVGCIFMPDSNQEVISFVNGISTYRGGTHVNHVIDKIVKALITEMKKKEKDLKVSTTIVKENLIFFINSTIDNPAFSSQTKDTLTTKVQKFGSSYTPDNAFLKKLMKSGILKQVLQLAKFKASNNLKKNDGKKKVKLRGIPKLEDANKAGSKESTKCTLILTEGDSAKAFAMAGLSIIGRDYYGVFPLKGKLLNIREASIKQRNENDEINYLKQIMGLKMNTDYSIDENFDNLRYGKIMCLTDQDVDGSHIKGLLINFFHFLWPSLVQRKGFITSLATPIVKAFKGKLTKTFYNLTEYEVWKEKDSSKGWNTKYYKGLGTSTSKEAKEYFVDVDNKLIKYYWDELKEDTDSESDDEKDSVPNIDPNDDAITKAFAKKRADDRKSWLMQYNKNNILTYEQRDVSYPDFIDKDMIHFSDDDLSRSIPSIMDGLKPSQRKILYGSFLRKLDKDEVKVAQLAGFVSDKAAYHHGEMSLTGAIIGMAQDFVGSNNINILKPNGQFGTRLNPKKDAASPRYIWTKLCKLTPLIFRPVDNPILNQQDDDGLPIEPEFYAPIIPMILINGAEGIGTGFSTKIPPYNPVDVINNILLLLDDANLKKMKPWWNKFTGKVVKIDQNNYETHGTFHQDNDKITITELPVGEWTTNYKEYLERELDKESKRKNKKTIRLLSYIDNNTDIKVHFELKFNKGALKKISDIPKSYRLIKKYSTTNMHLYSVNGNIRKYSDINDILNEFYQKRLELYQKRKDYQLNNLKNDLDNLNYKVKFILQVINKEIKINNRKKADIESKLFVLKYPKLGKDSSYQYLLGMPIYSLTFEKVQELKKQKNAKETEYNKLKETDIKDIWREELNMLLQEYNKWLDEKKKDEETSLPKKGKKMAKKSKKKSKKKNINI
jgi:DNA topoisomerase II